METLTLKQLTSVLTAPQAQSFNNSRLLIFKMKAGLLFLISDIVTLTLSLMVSIAIREMLVSNGIDFQSYFKILPFLIAVFPVAFMIRGLYPAMGLNVVEELRGLTTTISIVFALMAAVSFFVKGDLEFSRLVFILSWMFSVLAVPIFRSLIRKYFSKKDWWGIPVIVVGAGVAGTKVIETLQKNKQIGLKPVVAVDDNLDRWGYIHNVPVIGGLNVIPNLAKRLKIDNAIIAMPNVQRKRLQDIIQKYSKYFTKTIYLPDLYGLTSIWVASKDMGGILGLEVQQRLLKKTSQIIKRVFDLILASGLIVMLLPLFIIISILIKIDSKGKVFFKQERMGLNDKRFKIIKFRTMHVDAEKRLADILNHNKTLKEEFEIYHKLRNDPRLTRIGKFLRKYSLDELPQFWNVLTGEMSLIGPRAFMPWEKIKMNGHQDIILKVKPGISGFWQVTDRNQSSFEERIHKDLYYIRNWSMFLDFYIVARTISVVAMGKGAY